MTAMPTKLRWGVLSTANIGLKKVIPAMQLGEYTTIAAIASRNLAKAQEAAKALNIPTAYGSYEELLADPNIDAIYNPLPISFMSLGLPGRRKPASMCSARSRSASPLRRLSLSSRSATEPEPRSAKLL